MVDRIRQHITFLGGQAGASLLKASMRILVVRILLLTTGDFGAGLSWVQELQAWNLLSPTLAHPKSL